MERTLLVTGSSGLLGHAVLARVVGEYRCIGVDVVSACDAPERVVSRELDVRDAAGLLELVQAEQVTDVVHAGAISHPRLLADQPAIVVGINVQGTQHVLEAARLGGVRRVVFLSSAAVYGTGGAEGVPDQTAALRPTSIYGASKAAGEMLVRGYQACFGLETVILRPVSIYGPRRRTASVASYLVANALDGLPSTVSRAQEALDLIHVEDVARAVELALTTVEGVGRAYIIATGAQTRHADVAAAVCRLLPDSRIDLEPGGGPVEPRFDTRAAQVDLGFRADIDLDQGLRQMIQVLRERPDLRAQARAAYA